MRARALLFPALLAVAACAKLLDIDSVGYAEADAAADAVSNSDAGAVEICPADEPDSGGVTTRTCDGSGKMVDLLDSRENCGACGHSCLGDECIAGKCAVVTMLGVEDPNAPSALSSLDSTYLYWPHLASVERLRLDRGGVRTLVATRSYPADADFTQIRFSTVLVDSTSAYVLAADAIFRTDIDGGELVSLRNDGYGEFADMAIDPDFIYWTNLQKAQLLRMAKDGGGAAPVVTSSTLGGEVAADGTSVFWTDNGAPGGTMGSIKSSDPQGKNAAVVASALAKPAHLTLDRDHVYWASAATGEIARVAKTGGTPTLIARMQPPATVDAIAVDASYVYWLTRTDASQQTQTLAKASKCGGGGVIILATTDANASSLLLDEAHAYWWPLYRSLVRVAK